MNRITKKRPYGRIIRTKVVGNRVFSYHATKGWRSARA